MEAAQVKLNMRERRHHGLIEQMTNMRPIFVEILRKKHLMFKDRIRWKIFHWMLFLLRFASSRFASPLRISATFLNLDTQLCVKTSLENSIFSKFVNSGIYLSSFSVYMK